MEISAAPWAVRLRKDFPFFTQAVWFQIQTELVLVAL